jgi:hypothetical protein
MANFDILSRSDMIELINTQSVGIKTTTDQIVILNERMENLEKKVSTLSGNKRKKISPCEYNSEKKIQDMRIKYEELQKERNSIIAFNKNNDSLPSSERLKWSKSVKLSGGNVRVTSLTEVKDNSSLMALIDSEYSDILCNSSGEYVPFTKNIVKKSWVFIKDNKLVPLCRDFKDGIGVEYLWTSDEDMLPPSGKWIRESKKDKDPRRKYYDPLTMELWVPGDSEESKDCEKENVEQVVNDIIGGIVDNLSNL